MFSTIEKKIEIIKSRFAHCSKPEDRYALIIQMGTELPAMNASDKHSKNLVQGCQSQLYLNSELKDGRICYSADSDALISKGLAALMLFIYNEETPEAILKHIPSFLQELGIQAALSPTRSNGLANLHLQMKRQAIEYLVAKN